KRNSFSQINSENLLQQIGVTLNFLAVDKIANMFRQTQSALNYDTNKTKDGLQASFKQNELKEIRNIALFKNVDDIVNNASTSSFRIQPLIIDVFNKFLPTINSEVLLTKSI